MTDTPETNQNQDQAQGEVPATGQPAAAPAVPEPSPPSERVKIVGVRFKRAGRVYYFSPGDLEINAGDLVVAETMRGTEIGRVVIAPRQVVASEMDTPLKPVLRKADPSEVVRSDDTEKKEREALTECGKMVARLGLPMKLLSAEYSLEGNHITFFFSAAERVDFRELVRELASRFRVRVELRQVGARDETKILGGYGRCGRQLCCASWLAEFQPISIKMAKEQGLPLNPLKISGVCGRLLCCLSYEHGFYHDMRGKLPREGQPVTTPNGPARVVGTNPLKGTVIVAMESGVTVEVPLDQVKLAPRPEPPPVSRKPEPPAPPQQQN